MCDYSLMEFPNRLATDGEVLVVHRFGSGCLGLTSPADCTFDPTSSNQKRTFWQTVKAIFYFPEPAKVPAVCIPPGARLILHQVPAQFQKELGLAPDEEVKFMQISAAENQHRDAVCFRTGHILRLQELTVGQRLQVVDLGDRSGDEPEFTGEWETFPAHGANVPRV
jgi:hypothetical protein